MSAPLLSEQDVIAEVIREMRYAVFWAEAENGFLKIEGWADRLEALRGSVNAGVLKNLVVEWRARAEKDHAPTHDDAIYQQGNATAYDTCADELESVLASFTGAPQEK